MPQLFALVAIAVGVPSALLLAGFVSLKWVLLGAAAWAVAVVVKAGPGAALWLVLEKAGMPPRPKAAIWGVWSALCELGATAAVFIGSAEAPELIDAVAFGVGAGAVEAMLTVAAAVVAQDDTTPSPTGFVAWSGVVERLLASTGHIASRGLVWVGLQGWPLAPAILVGIATFAIVDGIASYGSEAKWDWTDADRLRWFYGLVAAVTAVEVIALVAGVAIVAAAG